MDDEKKAFGNYFLGLRLDWVEEKPLKMKRGVFSIFNFLNFVHC